MESIFKIFGERKKETLEEGFEFAPKFDADGLVPCITTDHKTGELLMVAYMNKESLAKTLEIGEAVYYSRSRKEIWHKGLTSGHTQKVVRWAVDCDADTLLFEVEQIGGACHTGYESCFFQTFSPDGTPQAIAESKVFDPEKTYESKK